MTDAIQKVREALEAARRTMRNVRGAVESNQAEDKDVRRQLTRGIETIDAALAALDAPAVGEGWRAMDSAPKDGTEVIYLTSYGSRWIGNEPPGHARGIWTLVEGEWRGMSSSSNDVAWHSLPSPPESRS